MAFEIFESWRQDPEFMQLPEGEKAQIYLNYFNETATDDEFMALPQDEQVRIQGNFLESQGLNFPQNFNEPRTSELSQDYEPPSQGFGNRLDGTPKGNGYFGILKRPDGKVSTELSIGVSFDGKERLIPSLVPTLSEDEKTHLLSGGEITRAIKDKAVQHARERMSAGKSPFAEEEDYLSQSPEVSDVIRSIPEEPADEFPPQIFEEPRTKDIVSQMDTGMYEEEAPPKERGFFEDPLEQVKEGVLHFAGEPGRLAISLAKVPWYLAGFAGGLFRGKEDDPTWLEEAANTSIKDLTAIEDTMTFVKPAFGVEAGPSALMTGGAGVVARKLMERAGPAALKLARKSALPISESLTVTGAKSAISGMFGDVTISILMEQVEPYIEKSDLSDATKDIIRGTVPLMLGIATGMSIENKIDKILKNPLAVNIAKSYGKNADPKAVFERWKQEGVFDDATFKEAEPDVPAPFGSRSGGELVESVDAPRIVDEPEAGLGMGQADNVLPDTPTGPVVSNERVVTPELNPPEPPPPTVISEPDNKAAIAKTTREFPKSSMQLYSMAPGAMAGLEVDENNEPVFNAEKAVLGMTAAIGGAALINKIGIAKRIKSGPFKGKYMRGGKLTRVKDPIAQFEKQFDAVSIKPEWDGIATLDEAKFVADNVTWLDPEIVDTRQNTRYKANMGSVASKRSGARTWLPSVNPATIGMMGNDKMRFPNETFPDGRTTYDYTGCGRGLWAKLNGIKQTEACYDEGCYAEAIGKGKGKGSIASGEILTSVGQGAERDAIMKFYGENDFSATKEMFPDHVLYEYQPGELKLDTTVPVGTIAKVRVHVKELYDAGGQKAVHAEYPKIDVIGEKNGKLKLQHSGKLTIKKRTADAGRPAKVSTNLQPADGQDIRLGVDTDGSAWIADKQVLDALDGTNARTFTIYSSAYHKPPPRHKLAERSIINVTVSGWHSLPENLMRLKWAKEARKNGWNVILREVSAHPDSFAGGKEVADLYNRFHNGFLATDFFTIQQPLHKGATNSKPKWKLPGCCKGSAANAHKCDQCEVTEGLGRGFLNFYGIKREGGAERILPGVKDYDLDVDPGGKPLQPIQAGAMVGPMAGMEVDEEGKFDYDPVKGALGAAAGLAGAKLVSKLGKSAVKQLSAENVDTLTKEVLSKMNSSLKGYGYDVRGADDVKALIKKRGVITNPDWIKAYENATGSLQKRKEKLRSKKELKNVDWGRLKNLGTTTDLNEAGYISPSGTLVDLSGKREGGQPGTRSYDHREAGGTAGMQEVISYGYIRMDAHSGTLDIAKAPTSKQYTVIRDLVDKHNGYVVVDMEEGLGKFNERDSYYSTAGRRFSREYPEGVSTTRVVNDIKKFFSGKEPNSITMRFHPSTITAPAGGVAYGVNWDEAHDEDGFHPEKLTVDPKKALIGAVAGGTAPSAIKHGRRVMSSLANGYTGLADKGLDAFTDFINGKVVNENLRYGLGMNKSSQFKDLFRTYKRDEARVMNSAVDFAKELTKVAPTKLEQKRLFQVLQGSVTANKEFAAKAEIVREKFDTLRKDLQDYNLLNISRFDKLTRKNRADIRNELSGPDVAGMDKDELLKRASDLNIDVSAKASEDTISTKITEHLDTQRQRLHDYYHFGSAREYVPFYYDKFDGMTSKNLMNLQQEIKHYQKLSRKGTPEGKQEIEALIADLQNLAKTGKGQRNFKDMKLDLGYSHRRQEIPIEVQRMMGKIEEGAYATGKGMATQGSDVVKAKLFKDIADNPEWTMVRGKDDPKPPSNFIEVKGKQYGDLDGKYVRNDVWTDLKEVQEWRSELGRVYDKALGAWKYGKVVLNPATQARNFASNMILAYFGDVSPTDVKTYSKAVKALRNKKTNKHFKEAEEWGLYNDTFYSAEIGKLRDSLKSVRSDSGKMKNWIRDAMSLPGEAYQESEKLFKTAVFIKARDSGMSVDKAAKKAEEHLFNYADIPPWVKWGKRWVSPFLTFTYKALPMYAKTAVRKPWKVAMVGAAMYGMEKYAKSSLGLSNEEAEKERGLLAPWMRDKVPPIPWIGQYSHILMPFRNKWGDNLYLDASYILPYGNLTSKWGQSAIVPQILGPNNPLFTLAAGIGLNKDLFTGRELFSKEIYDAVMENGSTKMILEENAKVLGTYAKYVWMQLTPSLAGYSGSKLLTGLENALDETGEPELDWADRRGIL